MTGRGTAALRAIRAGGDATVPPILLGDAIRLRVPLCFVVEPDGLWADRALERLLEEYAAASDAEGTAVARWTRSRRWTSHGAGFGLGLARPELSAGQADMLEEIVRLSEHLATAKRNEGVHPFRGCLFSIRGVQADLERPLAAEVLLGVVQQLLHVEGILLIELPGDPCVRAATLGPVLRLPPSPSLRYESPIAILRSTAHGMGAAEPEADAISDALTGLSCLQAEVAARVVRAEAELRGSRADVMGLLSAARDRVVSILGGAVP